MGLYLYILVICLVSLLINTLVNYFAVRKAVKLDSNLDSYKTAIPTEDAKKITWMTYFGSAFCTSLIFVIILLVFVKTEMGKKAICSINTNSTESSS
jgi:branched-subunit amino acid ABC-type transport system permease component